MLWALAFLVLLLVANAFLAMSETAIVGSSKARLQQWAKDGNKRAAQALDLSKQPELFLTCIQLGVNLIGITIGAVSESTLTEQLSMTFSRVPIVAHNAHGIATVIIITLVTYASFMAEIVPKRLALYNPEQNACQVSSLMLILQKLTRPLLLAAAASVQWLLTLLHPHPSRRLPITDAEILLLIRQGEQAGVFEQAEEEMVGSVLRLGSVRGSALMTARTELVWIDVNDPPEVIVEKLQTGTAYERLVADGTPDNPVGMLNVKDYLSLLCTAQGSDWLTIVKEPCIVPATESGLDILKLLKKNQLSSALVMNEYGGVEGLVTLRDLMEAIVGDLPHSNAHIRRSALDGNTFEVDGLTSMEEFREKFGLDDPPDQQIPEFDTVAGLLIAELKHIPGPGEEFDWQGLHMKVKSLDGYRIDKIEVTKAA